MPNTQTSLTFDNFLLFTSTRVSFSNMPLSPVDQFDELPTIKGPKLGRFREGRYSKKIDYLELLSPGGSHGYVFKVRIDGELFALKIVGTILLSLHLSSFPSLHFFPPHFRGLNSHVSYPR